MTPVFQVNFYTIIIQPGPPWPCEQAVKWKSFHKKSLCQSCEWGVTYRQTDNNSLMICRYINGLFRSIMQCVVWTKYAMLSDKCWAILAVHQQHSPACHHCHDRPSLSQETQWTGMPYQHHYLQTATRLTRKVWKERRKSNNNWWRQVMRAHNHCVY